MSTETKHIIQLNNQVQSHYTVTEQGQWLVVPVVMMTEGVRNGSGGPILHLADHYSRNPEAWNGTPVTAGHPQDGEGNQVSVNAVSQDQWIVGHLRNAHIEDNKLRADAYIHQQRAIAVNPEVLNYINEGRPLDVSIGAFTHDQPEQGEYEDQEYEAVTVFYDPDHLALLPGGRGACSWQDGCGIRNNQLNDAIMKDFQALKDQIKKGIGVRNYLQDNEAGFLEISKRIQSTLDRRDSEAMVHFLKEVYEDHFVYEVRNRDQGTQKYFQQSYEFDESQNDIDFDGERTEVRRNVEFVPLQNQEEKDCGCNMERTKFNTNKDNEDDIMSDKNKDTQPSGEVMEKAVSLINNEQTRFTKSDRSWLLQLNEDQLSTLEPKEAPEPEVTREQAIQALSEELGDVDKVKELVSKEVAEKIETGLAAYEDGREKLIKSIQTNTSKEHWPTETLQDMSTDNLERLAKSVQKVDFSGQGPVNNQNGAPQNNGDEQALYPTGIEVE